MFSPSLISAMVHSAVPFDGDGKPERFENSSQVARYIEWIINRPSFDPHTSLPVIVHAQELGPWRNVLGERDDGSMMFSGQFLWGRVPLTALARICIERGDRPPADRELADLAVPVNSHANGRAPSPQLINACQTRLQRTRTKPVTVRVALVDLGRDAGHGPFDFNGKVNHAETNNVDWSHHSVEVLFALLQRLEHIGILEETAVMCSLVKLPINHVGLACFKHACTSEINTALEKLHYELRGCSEPVSINLSLGAHIGPHNGDSPLERYVEKFAAPGSGRYLHVAAGNDGLKGIASARFLSKGRPDFLNLLTRPGLTGCKELLVELWWAAAASDPPLLVKADATIYNPGAGDHGKSLLSSPLEAVPGSVGADTFGNKWQSPVRNSTVLASMFDAKCCADTWCAAFMIKDPCGLPALDIEFELNCQGSCDVAAWVAVYEDNAIAEFRPSIDELSVNVPSTARSSMCVAGVLHGGKPWKYSSRGPGGPSGLNKRWSTWQREAPLLAHIVDSTSGGDDGTSLASPRACADTAALIKDPVLRAKCPSVVDIASELLGKKNVTTMRSAGWDNRIGYGSINS